MRRRPEDQTVVFPRGTAPPRPLQRSRLAPAAHGRGWLRRDTRARAHAAPSDAPRSRPLSRRSPGAVPAATGGAAAPARRILPRAIYLGLGPGSFLIAPMVEGLHGASLRAMRPDRAADI